MPASHRQNQTNELHVVYVAAGHRQPEMVSDSAVAYSPAGAVLDAPAYRAGHRHA
jgi:hypothetical protein